jgi:cyclopropane fatty-acyl-phospholipid synthase-like methyltransferase
MAGRPMDHLQSNYDYWNKGYEAENVESFVFRVYGRVFKAQFGLDGSQGEKILDFGCGGGAALNFFRHKGFDVYGVDMSKVDIENCQKRMPEIKDHFAVIDPQPQSGDVFFKGDYDIVLSIQTLYYLSDSELSTRLESLHAQMKPGALIYTSMMGTKCELFYKNSVEHKDGMRKVAFKNARMEVDDYYVNFTESKEDLLEKFKLFKPVHVGYYDACYREDEGSDFHYIFIGQK